MTNEEFLKDICPNHTDKSKWNKSELLHILDKYQALQLQQTGVMACFSEEQLSQINKYGKHQHNRASMDLSYISFEFWLK